MICDIAFVGAGPFGAIDRDDRSSHVICRTKATEAHMKNGILNPTHLSGLISARRV